MTVQMDGEVNLFLESLNQSVRPIRRKQGRHVFDTDRIDSHLCQFDRGLDVLLQRVDRTDGIDDRTLRVFARLFDGLDR